MPYEECVDGVISKVIRLRTQDSELPFLVSEVCSWHLGYTDVFQFKRL